MNEEKINMEVRKFLKKVGITSQREIERIIREDAGRLQGKGKLRVKMTLNVEGADIQTIEDTIGLG
ncbi:MAG: DUF6494 family protein [Gammaproteobacteria bacterium]|nr:DUF6494 family protein [Gammaproteobacteria bacterium]